MCRNLGASGAFLGAVRRYIVELEGPRKPFGTVKSRCMCRVAAISLRLAVFSTFWGSTCEMGEITAPSWCFGLGQNFGACHLWVSKTTTQNMSYKLNGGGQERASQMRYLGFKICNLGPIFSLFFPKTSLERAENGQTKGNGGYYTNRLHRVKGPSNSTVCPRTAPKRPPKTPKFPRIGCRQPQTKDRPYLGLRGSKCN